MTFFEIFRLKTPHAFSGIDFFFIQQDVQEK